VTTSVQVREATPTMTAAARSARVHVSISTGWALRNLVYTGIVGHVSRRWPVTVICPEQFSAPVREHTQGLDITVRSYEPGAEPAAWRLLRQARKKIYLESRDSMTERIWDEYGNRPFYKRLGSAVLKSLIRIVGAERLGAALEAIDMRLNARSPADAFFGPDDAGNLYFATHASTYFDESLLRAARRHCRRTTLIILSWDHLSSKIVVGRGFDHLCVWNDISKREILATMKAYQAHQIHVVGAPQFDVYGEPPSADYATWCRTRGLDPHKRTILFSTMPQVRHDGQHLILRRLRDVFAADPQRYGNLQMLVKVHPFDNSGLYDELQASGFIRILGTNLEAGKRQDEWIPKDNSMAENRDALHHSALNINIFSTMTLEAACLDRPIVHIAFDVEGQSNPIPCRKYYEFDHFRPIVDSGCSILALSFDELLQAIDRSLAQPDERAVQRKAVAQLYFGVAPGHSARLIEELVVAQARDEGAVAQRLAVG
jgi:hypothetical protein